MLALVVIVSSLAALFVPVLVLRYCFRLGQSNLYLYLPLLSFLANAAAFPITFLLFGQIGAGIGDELSAQLNIDPVTSRSVGLVAGVWAACVIIAVAITTISPVVRVALGKMRRLSGKSA